MGEEKQATDLNVYLLKTGTKTSDAIKTKGLKNAEVSVGGKPIGTLYAKHVYSNAPRWARFFEDVVPATLFGKNASTGALLAIPLNERMFVLTFGQGRHCLESEYIEMDFGLKVTLNLVDENSLRTIDKASFETHPRQSREQAGRATQFQYFEVDVERDLLRAVTGVPLDPDWGQRISGMDSLKLSLDTNLQDLPSVLARLLKAYSGEAYKTKGFSFVDHIRPVRDSSLIDALDNHLIARIKASKTDNLWLSVPEIIDWDRAVGFKYSTSPKAPKVYDVRLEELLESLGDNGITKEILLRRKIFCVDSDDLPVFDKPAYYYVYAEIPHDGKTYLLNGGKWYLVDIDFVQQINEYYKAVPRYQKPIPDFTHDDQTEGRYNERVSKQNSTEFSLLDKKNISLPGAVSPVEPCDLYRKPKEFIHVKRYGGSSLLSHLFNQGIVSGELFKREALFRKEVNMRLPAAHKISNIEDLPKATEYKIIFAIVSEHDEELSIPFFSKITLRHAVNRLTAIGFSVELAKISVDELVKKIKVIPAAQPKRKKAKAV